MSVNMAEEVTRQKDMIYSDVTHFSEAFDPDPIYEYIGMSDIDLDRIYYNTPSFDNEYNLAFALEISENFDVSQMQACLAIFDYCWDLYTVEEVK